MTLTINIPPSAEKSLQDEAARAGVTIPGLIEQVVAERFPDPEAEDSLSRLVAKIGGMAPPNVDVSREGIYADF